MLILWERPTLAIELYVPQVFEALHGDFTTDKSLICFPDYVPSYISHLHLKLIITESCHRYVLWSIGMKIMLENIYRILDTGRRKLEYPLSKI